MYFFFFASRRRHTRCSRDWSSDVCSSDLFLVHGQAVHEECRCSETRVMSMMRRFSPEDRRDMVGDNGRIGITCEFCSRFYDLDPVEVEAEIARAEASERGSE